MAYEFTDKDGNRVRSGSPSKEEQSVGLNRDERLNGTVSTFEPIGEKFKEFCQSKGLDAPTIRKKLGENDVPSSWRDMGQREILREL